MQKYGARGAGSSGRRVALRPINVGDEIEELQERGHSPRLAPRLKHVVGQMEFVIIPAVVLPEESLDSMPLALDCIRVCAGVRIKEVDAVVDSAMRITLRTKFAVRTPAITNDRSTGFDPVAYGGH